ncbi:MAG: hypothetical protein R3183_12735, partial [Oleiphilaceae bacterium]|nr:hypothetical protein [Oleiphilaceae bacterium]
MKETRTRIRRLLALGGALFLLAACGGGGGQDAFKEAVAVNELNVIAIEVQSDNSIIEPGMLEE